MGAEAITPETGDNEATETVAQTGDKAASETPASTFDPERAMRTIETLRQEVKDLKKLAKKPAAAQPVGQPDLNDQVKGLQSEIAKLKADAERATRKTTVITNASKAGFNDPEDAWLWLANSVAGEDGDMDELDEALEKLMQDKPYLVKAQQVAAQPQTVTETGTDRPTGSAKKPKPSAGANAGKTGQLTLQDIENMPPDEINRRWEEIEKVLKAQGSG